jgi:hypothetical protein
MHYLRSSTQALYDFNRLGDNGRSTELAQVASCSGSEFGKYGSREASTARQIPHILDAIPDSFGGHATNDDTTRYPRTIVSFAIVMLGTGVERYELLDLL